MKKKRTEPFPWFTMDDGRRVRFDGPRFRDEVDKMKREKRCSGSDVFRGIVLLLYPGYPNHAVDNNISTVRKWYDQKNGPRYLLDLYKPLAAHFKIEEDAFLKYEEIEEGHMMQTIGVQTNQATPNGCLFPVSESRMLIRAMERAKEKEAAHELYGMLVDLIAAYLAVDGAVWGTYNQEQEWKTKKIEEYPSCYPVELAIIKSSMYLPKEVRYRVEALLEDLYGEYGERTFVWQKGDHFSNGLTYDKLREIKHTQFEEYLKQKGKDPQNLNHFQETALWVTMISDEENELFDRLDDIFADYLCD